jgi:hypothetical protein
VVHSEILKDFGLRISDCGFELLPRLVLPLSPIPNPKSPIPLIRLDLDWVDLYCSPANSSQAIPVRKDPRPGVVRGSVQGGEVPCGYPKFLFA